MDTYQSFGEKLHALRTQKALTVSALAKQIGVSTRAVACWEAGSSYPTDVAIYDQLASVFGVDVNVLKSDEEVFMTEVMRLYGSRGVRQAQELDCKLSSESGPELSPEDERAFIQEIRRLFLDAKQRAKKCTPTKYRKDIIVN